MPIAAAGEGPDAERATFEDESRVVLVQVPVHVTTRDGEPIHGLDAAEFRLWNDGEEQDIARLEIIDQARVTTEIRSQAGELSADDLPAAARRKLLLLFDLSFARPASVVKARDAALDFVLHELAPGDLAAVATVSVEQGARLLVTFTTDRAQLARAIDTLGQPGLTGPASGDPLRFVLERPTPNQRASRDDRSQRGQFDRMLEEQLDLFRSQRRRMEQSFERGRISDWTRSLAALAGSLVELQGDKHVVVFSEGFDSSLVFGREPPLAPGNGGQIRREQGAYWTVDQDETFGSSALQSDVADMARVFRRAGARLHAVDVGGLRSSARADEEAATDRAPRGGRDSLFFVADATGGELLRDANDFSAGLRRLLQRSSVTYLLSFYPRLSGNSVGDEVAYRELKVQVAGLPRGARVEHREGYFEPRPFTDLPPLERMLLTSESLTAPQPKQDLEVALLVTAFRAGEKASYVPVILELDGESLLSALRDETRDVPREELHLEVYVYAGDREGEIQDFATQHLRATRDALEGRHGLKFYAHLRLPPGPHQLRALVRDRDDGRTTVITRQLDVPGWTSPELLPPFAVQDDGAAWVMVRQELDPDRAGETTIVYPYLLDGEPYVPMARPAVRPGETLRIALVGYGLDAKANDPDADGWTVTMFGDDGVAHPDGALRDLESLPTRVEDQTQLIGRLDPEGLRPGNYLLEVTTPDGATASMGFRVLP